MKNRIIQKVTIIFILIGWIQLGYSQKNIIIEADAILHGKDAIPTDDGVMDSLFFFNRLNLNLYAGIMNSNDLSFPQIDSLGFGGVGFGQDVYPMGTLSFAQGAGNYSRGIVSSSFGIGNTNYSYGGTSLGILSDPIITTSPVEPFDGMPLLNIGNGDLIFGDPHNALTVYYDGSLEINQEYTLPNVDGLDGQILSTDGNGNLSWTDDVSVFERIAGLVRSKGPYSDNFVFGSDSLLPSSVVSDTLFFFDTSKGAFRTGRVLNTDHWKQDTLGSFSFASGSNTLAEGDFSTAFGFESKAIGLASMSWGHQSSANGIFSTAWGFGAQANGTYSTAWGTSRAAGVGSTSWGSGRANAPSSTAWGAATNADGLYATVWGSFVDAIGEGSTAWGNISKAMGEYSTSWGYFTDAIGDYSTSWGNVSKAEGDYSTAWGVSEAMGEYSTSWGYFTDAIGDYSTSLGYYTKANTFAGVALGRYNEGIVGNDSAWVSSDPLLEVGIGSSISNGENALTILKDGTISFKEYTFPLEDGTPDQVLKTDGTGNISWTNDNGVFENNSGVVRNSGSNTNDFVFGLENLPVNGIGYTENLFFFDESLAAFRAGGLTNSTNWQTSDLGAFSIGMGQEPTAFGTNSIALGFNANATEESSVAIGNNSSSIGTHSVAIGRANSAEGDYALSMGELTTAIGNHSSSFGWNTNAVGNFSSASGQYTNADAFNSFVIGRYNKGGGNATSWVATDPLFEIGNGSDFQGNESNAFTVLKNGNTGIGTHTPDEVLSVIGTIRGANEEAETNFIEMGHGGNNAFINADGVGNIDIRHSDQNIMTLTSSRNVGIKISNPESDLHLIHSNSGSTGGVRLQNTSSSDHVRLYVSSSNGHLRLYSDDQAGAIGDFNDASGVYSATSDRRLKEEFESLRFDWDSFMKLQTLMYEYKKDETNQKHIGMIAQDVMDIYPEVVTYDEEEDIYRMNYDAFGVIAIKAIQEQQQMLQTKSEKINELEGRLSKIEASLSMILMREDAQPQQTIK